MDLFVPALEILAIGVIAIGAGMTFSADIDIKVGLLITIALACTSTR